MPGGQGGLWGRGWAGLVIDPALCSDFILPEHSTHYFAALTTEHTTPRGVLWEGEGTGSIVYDNFEHNIDQTSSNTIWISPQLCLSVLPTWQLAPPEQVTQESTRRRLQCLLQPSLRSHIPSSPQSPFSHAGQSRCGRGLHKGVNIRNGNTVWPSWRLAIT